MTPPMLHPPTILEVPDPLPDEGLDTFLLRCGILTFTDDDVHALRRAGKTAPPLPRAMWRNCIPPLRIGEWLIARTGIELQTGNVYRPEPLNRQVGGAMGSAHVTAQAVDFDIVKAQRNAHAEEELRTEAAALWVRHGRELQMGLGFYGSAPYRLHVDVGHPEGYRYWSFRAGYTWIRRGRARLKELR